MARRGKPWGWAGVLLLGLVVAFLSYLLWQQPPTAPVTAAPLLTETVSSPPAVEDPQLAYQAQELRLTAARQRFGEALRALYWGGGDLSQSRQLLEELQQEEAELQRLADLL